MHPIPLLNDAFDNRPVWTPPPRETWVRMALLLYCALLFLPNLGAFGLWDPWETHYGAVATNMVETHEWISPWWGYKEQIGTEAQQGKHFFSKPIFIFWAEAFFSSLLGHGEWAMRLPMALLGIASVFAVYLTLSMVWCRRTGLIGAVVVATSPQFFMMSRQAQTDMPFVSTLTIALCAFLLACFGPLQLISKRGFWKRIVGWICFLALNTIPQYAIIATDLNDNVPEKVNGIAWVLATIQFTGLIHVLLYSLGLVVILGWFAWELRRDLRQDGYTPRVTDKWLRRGLLVGFYIVIAQSTYAKGLLGFALPGLFVLAYLTLSGHWQILKRVELIRGVGICLAVGLPWYVAMFARHGNAFYQRFFIHDHFNRLASGVHQIDTGNFEHFVKWLGFGIYPWTIFAPLVCIWLLLKRKDHLNSQYYARLFMALWFTISFAFFTFASTKFHHYIFPALPALGMLTAIFLNELIIDRGWLPRLTAFVAIIFFAILIRDLQSDPQHIRNLMTYKYDRPMPEHLPIDPQAPVAKKSSTTWQDSYFWKESSPTLLQVLTTDFLRYELWIPVSGCFGLLALLLFFAARTRRAGLVALGLMSSAMAIWSLNYYMPMLSPHWSQKYLFDAYYDTCTPQELSEDVVDAYTPMVSRLGLGFVAEQLRYRPKQICKEDVLSWRITWRGETYYSYNEVQPITKEAEQFLPYLEERNDGEPFYVLMERGKMGDFKGKLDNYSEKLRRKKLRGWVDIEGWTAEVINDESLYFQMVKATPNRNSPSG